MLYGVSIFSTDYSSPPSEIARLAEEHSFESLWLPEHTHIPASRMSPWPGGGTLPKEYWHTYDPFLALTAAALTTKRLRLATGICLVIERDPIVLAKEVATLDQISNGRFIFGVGGGWNAEEMENHGTNFKKRWRVLRERILAMKEIWSKEEAEFHGEHVNFDKIWAYPKPVQRPNPPIIMGGYGPTTFDRIVEFCDGWIPIAQTVDDTSSLADRIVSLRQRTKEAGRDPASVSVTVWGVKPERDAISEMEEAGVDRVLFSLPSADRETLLPLLDEYATLFQ